MSQRLIYKMIIYPQYNKKILNVHHHTKKCIWVIKYYNFNYQDGIFYFIILKWRIREIISVAFKKMCSKECQLLYDDPFHRTMFCFTWLNN